MAALIFDESQIQRLFGHEAAEDESLERLRDYYFKSSTYDQVVTDLPLRILVGHKGIGKSALFQVAMSEDEEASELPILIKPDDITGLAGDTSEFLRTIRHWKNGLVEIMAKKVIGTFGGDSEDLPSRLARFGGVAIDFLTETFKKRLADNVDLDPASQLVMNNFLKTKTIIVYMDDLDRGWQGRKEDVMRISALLNAVRDIIKENPGVKFKISLRSDVYYLVRTSDESTDKIEGSVIWQTWTNHEILVLLVKRIETFFGRSIDQERLLKLDQKELGRFLLPVMEARFSGMGHWSHAPIHRVLMSLIRKRPRDLVKLCTLAARNAYERKRDVIQTDNFENIFEEYSQGRLQDTINEFRSELPDIERLLVNMKPNKKERTTKAGYVYKTDGLLQKIDNICQMGAFDYNNGTRASSKSLASFLYKINFLTARKETSEGIVRKYFEESRYLSSDFYDFGFDWEIHPAYRWALQPGDLSTIYSSLKLDK